VIVDQVRSECARVARRAREVRIDEARIQPYARALASQPATSAAAGPGVVDAATRPATLQAGRRAALAGYWLTLDAINFGSGWFPTLRKRSGRSGYFTIAAGLRERWQRAGPWTAAQLAEIGIGELAAVLGQEPEHELIGLFAGSLRDLGSHLRSDFGGSFEALLDSAGQSAVALVEILAGWACFADVSVYDGAAVPFLKRAQIAAADLARAGVAAFNDLPALTMFADNLVPHVLRLDGVLRFDPELVARIERQQLIEHGSPEEVEIRACAVHAVELIVHGTPQLSAAAVDELLWNRGQLPFYKASPRHRSRCTAY
jgi:hypothetical protein